VSDCGTRVALISNSLQPRTGAAYQAARSVKSFWCSSTAPT